MRIEITEHDGEFNGGVPNLVILLIDGKKRVPYPADKTIKELYKDVSRMVNPSVELEEKGNALVNEIKDNIILGILNTIEREDIVVCTKVTPRDGNQDLVQGNEYRVIEIIKQNKVVTGYEVIDDKSDFRIRIPVSPDEIKLVRKAPPKKPRNQKFEVTRTCECGELNVLELNGNRYEAECVKCNAFLTERRKGENVNSI